jgi:hypothetical protein
MMGVLFVLIIPNPDLYPDACFCPPIPNFPVTRYCFVLPNQPVTAAKLPVPRPVFVSHITLDT